jgi:hypothetical protein
MNVILRPSDGEAFHLQMVGDSEKVGPERSLQFGGDRVLSFFRAEDAVYEIGVVDVLGHVPG